MSASMDKLSHALFFEIKLMTGLIILVYKISVYARAC